MKNFLIGLIIGLLLCGGAAFFVAPGIKKAAYDSGFETGNKKGITTGTSAGVTQGIEECKAQIKQAHDRDSTALVQKAIEAKRKAEYKAKKVVKEVQNWHVIDGKIADPVQ